MADISFTPRFHHLPWLDNVDRCEAGGTNGFNVRFDTIESDLHDVSTVVGQIDTSLDELQARVPPLPPSVTLSLAPTFGPIASTTAWAIQPSGAAVAPTLGGPSGVLPLTLPDRVRLTSVRIRGRGVPPAGLNTAFLIVRVAVADGATANVAAFDTSTVPFNTAFPITDTSRNQVDLANFRYVMSASSGAGTGDPVTLWSLQITYTNP